MMACHLDLDTRHAQRYLLDSAKSNWAIQGRCSEQPSRPQSSEQRGHKNVYPWPLTQQMLLCLALQAAVGQCGGRAEQDPVAQTILSQCYHLVLQAAEGQCRCSALLCLKGAVCQHLFEPALQV